MAASVRIEDEAFSDLRIEHLGAILGTSKYDAIGRLAHLWRHCTATNSYTLDPSLVGLVVDQHSLVAANLAEIQEDGHVRMKGTEGRIEWLFDKRESSVKGGKARAKSAKRGPGGTFAPSTPPASAGDAGASTEPAQSSAPAPAPAPAKEVVCPPAGGQVPEVHRFDFEAAYKRYPRREGKAKGLQLAKTQIRSQAAFEQFTAAVDEMDRVWAGIDRTDEQYQFIPLFSSWMSAKRWQDETQAGPSKPKQDISIGHYRHTGDEQYDEEGEVKL